MLTGLQTVEVRQQLMNLAAEDETTLSLLKH